MSLVSESHQIWSNVTGPVSDQLPDVEGGGKYVGSVTLAGGHKEMSSILGLSWLTNSSLVYEPNGGGGGVAWSGVSAPMSTTVHMEPE
jgi:hypothetical protein